MTIELRTAKKVKRGTGNAPVVQRSQTDTVVTAAEFGEGLPLQTTPVQRAAQIDVPAMRTFAQPVRRDVVSTLPSINGRFGMFDRCTDADIISLTFQGTDPFMDWLGARLTSTYLEKRAFIGWQRAAYSSGSPTAGWVSDPCADPAGVDYGVCDFTLTDFARLRRGGPTRDVTENEMNYCVTQPRFRIDGSQIMNVDEYDSVLAMEAILGDFRNMLITGNASTSGQFNGLQRLVKTGYLNSNNDPCPLMDSQIINWNSNTFAGGNGITYNGGAVANTYGLIDALLFSYRTTKSRIAASPMLAAQPRRAGDIIIMLPDYLARCLLDAFTCWSVCPGKQYNETNLQTYEARNFRNTLNGGMFGNGQITLDGDTIPILSYDYGNMVTGGVIQLTSLTESTTTVTATTRYAHGLTTGDSVTVSGANDAKYNITATVTVTGATTFTYTAASGATSPDTSTSAIVTIPSKGDIYMLTGSLGNQKLMEVELLNMTGATNVDTLATRFATLDSGRYLTWIKHVHTCLTRYVEMRPRLLSWAPWANTRIQNVTCASFGPVLSMNPYSAAFPVKNFITAH